MTIPVSPTTVTVRHGTLVAAVLALGCSNHSDAVPFDAELWRSGGAAEMTDANAPRLRMADSLVNNGFLIGKSRSEVESMLGPQTQTSKFSDYDFVYWLGPERGFMSIDSEWLVLDFNDKDLTADAKIVRD